MYIFISLMLFVGCIALLLICPAIMSIGLIRMENSDFKLRPVDYVISCIPIVNVFYSCARYGDKKVLLCGIGTILMYISIFLRYLGIFVMYENRTFNFTTVFVFLISVFLYWVFYAISIFIVLNDSGLYSTTAKILYSLSVIIGEIQIGMYLPKKVKYYLERKSTNNIYG